jgi:tripartite-type tricarboxylate transporter receptor subunit TctC
VGLSAPAKTPRVVIDKLHAATEKALQDPAMVEKLGKLGVEPRLMSVDEFNKFFKDDLVSTVQLAKDAQIQPVD